MKKKMFGRLGAAAVALTLITTAMMSGTLAKYTSTDKGTVTVKAAAWDFKATNKAEDKKISDTDALDLGITTKNGIEGNMIAPGSQGEFDVVIDNSGSDINATYEIKVDVPADATKEQKDLIGLLSFKMDGVDLTLGTATAGKTALDHTGDAAKKTVKVTWVWEGKNDTDDVAVQGQTIPLEVTVTGTQVDVAAP